MRKIQRDDGENDKILRLPRNVIDLIIGFLPVRDAARTSVLSTKWRYVWVDQPSLVLDQKFWADIERHTLSNRINIDFAGIVNKIILRHIGSVQKFVVDISVISSERHCDISLWLSVLCGRGVKELSIGNSASNAYTIPACVFYAPELTSLSISNCIIKTVTFPGFRRLQSLTLNHIAFDSTCVLVTPLLTYLSVAFCSGARGFTISAPKLERLLLTYNDYINMIPYLTSTTIKVASISMIINFENRGGFESVNLLKLFHSWPNLALLVLDESVLKYLTTGIVLDDFSLALKLTQFVGFFIGLHHSAWILRIVGNSPFLQTLEILLYNVATNDLEALKYLEEPSIMSMRFQKLHTVKLWHFKGLKSELQLVKILLHCSPSLKTMLVIENTEQACDERLKIAKELMCFQRAYPKPEIIFA